MKSDQATFFHAIATKAPLTAAIPAKSAVAPRSKRASARHVFMNGMTASTPTIANHIGAIPIAQAEVNQTPAASASPTPHVRPRIAALAATMSSTETSTVIQRS